MASLSTPASTSTSTSRSLVLPEWFRGRRALLVLATLVGVPLAAFALPLLLPLLGLYLAYEHLLGKPKLKPSQLDLKNENENEKEKESEKEKKSVTATRMETSKPKDSQTQRAQHMPKQPEKEKEKEVEETGAKPSAAAPQSGGLALLRKMRERREAQLKTAKEDPAKQILVAYASQTGTAHEIAKGLHAQLASQTSTKVAVLSAFNDVNIKNLRADKFPIVAFVAASTGDGDPPDNTASFYAKMLRMKSEDRYVLWLCECERRKKKEERVTNGSRKKKRRPFNFAFLSLSTEGN